MKTKYLAVAAMASLALGCAADKDANEAGASAPPNEPRPMASAPAGPETDAAPGRTGRIEIDGETWTVVPSIQCSIFPDQVIAIAGHAAEDEGIEISIEYDGSEGGLIQAAVGNADGSSIWVSNDDSMSIEVAGDTVTGTANFSSTSGGSTRTAEGTFKVTCG